MKYKYLFGPVPSRRLGLSLGVDLVPQKICSLNCVYCECGRTTELTMERKEFHPYNEITGELHDFLKNKPEIDFITFSGSGEPTLYKGIAHIVKFLKTDYPEYSIALLTNSTLLGDKEVQEEIMDVDVVLPSLDAVSEGIFQKINKPCASLTSCGLISGLTDFSKKFKGLIWLEVFIIPGLNDAPGELTLFKDTLSGIRCEKIQLNSLDRPGTDKSVKKAALESLLDIKDFLAPLPVEIVSKYNFEIKDNKIIENTENKIIKLLQRRPCTVEDIMLSLNLTAFEAKKYLNKLAGKKNVEINKLDRGIFYKYKN